MVGSGARRWMAGCWWLFIVGAGLPAVARQQATTATQAAADADAWYGLEVPGGRATLSALGVAETRERAAVMVELVRRLHFAVSPPTALDAAVRSLARVHEPPPPDARGLVLPSPLPAETWSRAIFERRVPPGQLFAEILADPAARLLFHGLAGLDAGTRRWIGAQPDLLRRLYRNDDAVRAFALFAPAVRVEGGRVVVPGGDGAAAQWAAVVDATAERAASFVERLFTHHAGRTAGVYFLIAAVEAPRQRFLLGAGGSQELARLVAGFAQCYPQNSTATYPFAVRSFDPALLLLEVGLTAGGAPAGPAARAFWQRVFDGEPRPGDLPGRAERVAGGASIDAAWMVETLCAAPSARRGAVFTALLAGQRVFAGIGAAELPDALIALRARQAYPAVFMALEHAGIGRPRTYAVVATHAARLATLEDAERAVTATRQFQGALALAVNAAAAGSFDPSTAADVIDALAAVPFERDRYDGRLVTWLTDHWRPAVERGVGPAAASAAEDAAALGLAGPPDAVARRVSWEGRDYVLDVGAAASRRVREARRRQGGLTLDHIVELHRIATAVRQRAVAPADRPALGAAVGGWSARARGLRFADEYAGDGPDVAGTLAAVARDLGRLKGASDRLPAAAGDRLMRGVDVLLGDVLASWAYAPYLGDGDSTALTAWDVSLRHVLGVRTTGRRRFEQRWDVAVADGGAMAGSLLVLQPAVAPWLLRRLSTDVLPAAPTIGGSDLLSLGLTAALSDPRRLTDDDMARLVAALDAGAAAIAGARRDSGQLVTLAATAALSPWRREVLPWMRREEPDRIDEQFSLTERARLGGMRADDLHAWGAASIATGCLCLRMPEARVPEVILGRAADGIVGGHSVDLMLRVATLLTELKMPAALASPVLRYAMRDFLDAVMPGHAGDVEAFARQARALDRTAVEDYLGAIAAIGPLRPRASQP